MNPNELVRAAPREVKGNFRHYKYPNSYIPDTGQKMERTKKLM